MNKEPFSSPFWTPPLLSERSSGREERCRDRERWRIDGASMTAAAAAFRSPYVRILPFPFSVPPPSLFVLCKEKRRGGGEKLFHFGKRGRREGKRKSHLTVRRKRAFSLSLIFCRVIGRRNLECAVFTIMLRSYLHCCVLSCGLETNKGPLCMCLQEVYSHLYSDTWSLSLQVDCRVPKKDRVSNLGTRKVCSYMDMQISDRQYAKLSWRRKSEKV